MTYDGWKTTEATDPYREDDRYGQERLDFERGIPVETYVRRMSATRKALRDDAELSLYVCPDCLKRANVCECYPDDDHDHAHDSKREEGE